VHCLRASYQWRYHFDADPHVGAAETGRKALVLVVVVDAGPVWQFVWKPCHETAERSARFKYCLRVVIVVDTVDEVSTGSGREVRVIDDVDLTQHPEVTDWVVGRWGHDVTAVRYDLPTGVAGVRRLTDTAITILLRDTQTIVITWVALTEVHS